MPPLDELKPNRLDLRPVTCIINMQQMLFKSQVGGAVAKRSKALLQIGEKINKKDPRFVPGPGNLKITLDTSKIPSC